MSQRGPDEAKWYVCLPGGRPDGPLALHDIREGVDRGAFPAGSLVCRVGDEDWKPVEALHAGGDGTEIMDSTTVDDDVVETLRRLEPGPRMHRGGPGGTLPMPAQPSPAPPTPPAGTPAPSGTVPYPGAFGGYPPSPPASVPPLPALSSHRSNTPPRWGQRKSVIAVVFGGAVLGLAALAVGGLWLMQRPSVVVGENTADPATRATGSAGPAAPASSADLARTAEPASDSRAVADKKPAPAAPDDVDSTCREGLGLPEVLCTWVIATAEGRSAERPSYEMLQTFLLREDIMRAKGRIKSEPLSEGLVKVTLDGVFGYCLRPAEPVENGALYQKWIRRHEGTREIQASGGKSETCALLEEVPIGPIVLLMSADSPAEREKRAKAAVEAMAAYTPLPRSDPP